MNFYVDGNKSLKRNKRGNKQTNKKNSNIKSGINNCRQ